MSLQPPENESPASEVPPDRTIRRKWTIAAKWLVIQGVVNLLIIWMLPEGTLFPFDASKRYEARTFEYADARGIESAIPYRLMRPVSQKSLSPLVVFLHGAGERGSDNLSQLKYLPEQMATAKLRKRYPCFLLAPQIPTNSAWVLLDQREVIISLIEQTIREEPGIDPTRIYLTGLSLGGSGTWSIAGRRPDLFAAAVPVCGTGNPKLASALSNVPIWAVHGTEDSVIPVRHSREMISGVSDSGGLARLSELPGVGHESWLFAYDDSNGILEWMFKQVRSPKKNP